MKELYTAAGIFVVLILLGVWMVQNNRNEQEKKLVQLRKKWGKKQEKRTAREKKEKLEACLRRKAGENFCVDAITWNDLDLDSMYMMVNQTISSPGEDVLYSMMRLPVFSKEEADKREDLIQFFAASQQKRERLLQSLAKISKNGAGSLSDTVPSGQPGAPSFFACLWIFLFADHHDHQCGGVLCRQGQEADRSLPYLFFSADTYAFSCR